MDNNTEVVFDRLNNPTTLIFDDRGNITEEIDALGNSVLRVYDVNDNEKTVTNKRNFTTLYDYDARGNVIRITDPVGNTMEMTYNARNDMVTRKDELDRVTTYVYDANGNLREEIDALGHSILQTFDAEGRVLTRTDRNNHTTTFEYDSGCACPRSPSRIIHPDDAEKIFTYNQFGQLTTATDELGNTTVFSYDDAGRPVSTELPDGQVTTNIYTGQYLTRQVTKLNATQDRVTELVYDAAGNITLVTDANNGLTRFTYDAEDNVASLTDPVNNTTVFEYDALQRLDIRRDPMGNETHYAYDEEGNVSEILDRNGRFRRFEYDQLDRQFAEQWLEPDETLVRTITSTYDAVGNLLMQSDPDSSYTWTYDDLNRVTSEDNLGTPDLPRLILTRVYDNEGNRTAVYDNFGVRVDSVYSDRNELLSKTWSGGGIDEVRVDFAYNDRGDRVTTDRFADLAGTQRVGRSAMEYDDSGRTTGITHLDALDAVIADYDYVYDLANRLVQETHHGETIDYGYDLLGQLTSADRTVFADEFYTYDANGNRISSHLHGSNYITGPNNRLLSDGDFNYEYDDEGSLIRKTEIATGNVTEYEYDHRNRLVEVVEKTSAGDVIMQIAFFYDSFDRQIVSITDGIARYAIYDNRNTWAHLEGASQVAARYLYGDDVDEIVSVWWGTADATWQLVDRLGSVSDVTNAQGILTTTVLYDGFGGA